MIHHELQYVEFVTKDFNVVKEFYSKAFGWEFTDWGPEYISFEGEHVSGGFGVGDPQSGTIMPILYSEKLEESQKSVEEAGGTIVREIFSFPGGRRFEFTDPDKNHLAVWSDT